MATIRISISYFKDYSTLVFQKGAINPLMEYLIILVFGCSTYDVTRVVCCVYNELMVFKLIP